MPNKGTHLGGRKRKSIQQKKFEGTYRADRDGAQEKAEKIIVPVHSATTDLFPVPDEITNKEVRSAFNTHIQMLETVGYLCEADYEELSMMYVYLQKYKEYLAELNQIELDDENYDKVFNRMNRAQSKFSEIGKKYLLSPEARLKFALDTLTAKDKAIEVSKKEKSITEQILGGEAIV